MCGIAGFVDLAGHDHAAARARVTRMADTLWHRGPDAGGSWSDGHAALGHRRLSIIDRAGGAQPMEDPDRGLCLSFNGEIYNFRELRRELQGHGHAFHTRSDTEVILASYRQWGEAGFARLEGMFAFALWDARRHCLLLARDRVGKKPLYWHCSGQRLVFGSELKALRSHGGVTADVDPEALDCYLTLGYVPAPRTIHPGVYKLEPAHWLRFDARGLHRECYWRIDFRHPQGRTPEAAVEEFEDLLDRAVAQRLESEVPLGVFLSGGIDSSLVVASMARLGHTPIVSNSIGFADPRFDELPAARVVASHFGTAHHEFTVRPQAMEVLPAVARHCDEPLADPSALATWYVCAMARRQVTVALSGDGGDEGFGGYTFRYVPHMYEARLRARLPTALRTLAFGAAGALWPASARLPRWLRLKSILENLATTDSGAYFADLAWLRADLRQQLYQPAFLAALRGFGPREVVEPWYADAPATDPLSRSQHADLHLYLGDDVLAKVDRMSMAHALEVRSPLLDRRILEFAATLPASLRLAGGTGKQVLRRAARRCLPAQVVDRPKQGFSIPAARWLRGELRQAAYAMIFDSARITGSWLDPAVVKRLWSEHQSGARDHHMVLWGLMMFGYWQDAVRP